MSYGFCFLCKVSGRVVSVNKALGSVDLRTSEVLVEELGKEFIYEVSGSLDGSLMKS